MELTCRFITFIVQNEQCGRRGVGEGGLLDSSTIDKEKVQRILCNRYLTHHIPSTSEPWTQLCDSAGTSTLFLLHLSIGTRTWTCTWKRYMILGTFCKGQCLPVAYINYNLYSNRSKVLQHQTVGHNKENLAKKKYLIRPSNVSTASTCVHTQQCRSV